MQKLTRYFLFGVLGLSYAVIVACAIASPSAFAAAPADDAASRCAALAGTSLAQGTARVDDAVVVPASGKLAAACVAHATLADSTLRFELRMPLAAWNGKLAFLGGGGFDGRIIAPIEPQFSASITSGGYATMATNGGYDYAGEPGLGYFEAAFARDARQLADFTFESEHRALPPGKELLAAFLGKPPTRSYFEGCSMGGHDALVEAQRYPGDFDGIVARSPAGNIMGLFLAFNRVARLAENPASAIDVPRQKALAAAVLAQCDAVDGTRDGIVARPMDCAFDAKSLHCGAPGTVAATCLSDAQVAFVDAVTSPIATSDGAWKHPGFPFGGEDQPKGWGEYAYASPLLGGRSLQGLFSDGFLRSFVARDKAFDTAKFDPEQWRASLDIVGAMFSATDADLRPLIARGAKLLLWNGTTDSSVSVRDTVGYYERVVAKLGQAQADKGVELFLAPGVGHCFGGTGPDQVDLLAAMDRWVETGVAPSQQALVHRKLDTAGKTTSSRPLCKYPAYARHDGKGALDDASSFACAMP